MIAELLVGGICALLRHLRRLTSAREVLLLFGILAAVTACALPLDRLKGKLLERGQRFSSWSGFERISLAGRYAVPPFCKLKKKTCKNHLNPGGFVVQYGRINTPGAVGR